MGMSYRLPDQDQRRSAAQGASGGKRQKIEPGHKMPAFGKARILDQRDRCVR